MTFKVGAIAVVAAVLGGAAGYAVGGGLLAPATPGRPEPEIPAAPALDGERTTATALRDLANRLAAVERALLDARGGMRQQATPPPDTELPSADPLVAEVQRLSDLIMQLHVAQGASATEALGRARQANPQMNLARAQQVRERLSAEEELEPPHRTCRQEWQLRSMAEVMTQLGPPTLVSSYGSKPSDILWEYFISKDQVLGIVFRSGIVVAID